MLFFDTPNTLKPNNNTQMDMKNYFLPGFIFLFLGSFLQAQPILNSSVFPSIGVVVKTTIGDTTQVNPGIAGSNQIWDFSNLKPSKTSGSYDLNYISPVGTPGSSIFPDANLVAKYVLSDTIVSYSYFQAGAGELKSLGNYLTIGKNASSTISKELFLKAPLSFNANFTDQFPQVFSNSGVTTRSLTTKTLTYDAFGALKMPNAVFKDVMRLKTISNRRDTTTITTGGGTISNTTTTNYNWYVNGRVGALLTIVVSEGYTSIQIPNIPPQTIQTKNVTVTFAADLVTSAADLIPESVLDARITSANPAQEELIIQVSSKQALLNFSLVVFDLAGKPLQSQTLNLTPGQQTIKISIDHLPAGIYQAVLKQGNAVKALPFVKL
jgi:hypothetical protein